MLALLSILLIIIAVVLILAVLIQPGKSDMIAGMTGISGQFNSMLGTKGATNLLSKITIGLAISILIFSIAINGFVIKGSSANTGSGSTRKAMSEGKKPANIQTVPMNPGQQQGQPKK